MRLLLVALLLSWLTGCSMASSVANSVVDPDTDFLFTVATTVNPDGDGRPSPVVLRYYELASRAQFDNQDFFTLFDQPETALGPDLLVKDELEFQPGEQREITRRLNPNARFVGLVAAFRDIEGARWRTIVEVDPTGYDHVVVNLEALAVFIQPE